MFSQHVVVFAFVLGSLFILIILLLQMAAIRPWGNFPLNDDWGHALLTRQFASTGHFRAFIPVTPSLVLQAWWGRIFVDCFGFSHVTLRLANVGAALLFGWVLDRIFALLSIRRDWRWLGLAVWLLNPLVTLLTFSFMSDIFGLLISYLGVLLWFLHLRRESRDGWTPATHALALLSALLMGLSFWTRQLSVLVFGGAALGRLTLAARDEGHRALGRMIRRYLPAALAFLLPVIGYFAWARGSQNLNPDFTSKLHLVGVGRVGEILLQIVIWTLYQTAFALPLLLLVAAPRRLLAPLRNRRFALFCLAVVAVALANFHYGNRNYDLKSSIHSHFPILGNDLNPYGIGPITLTDIYILNAPLQPSFWRWPWILFELALLVALPIWGQLAGRAREIGRDDRLRREAVAFGAATLFVTWLANSLFFGKGTFDRYVLAAFPAVLISLLAVAGRVPIARRSLTLSGALLALYAYYGIGGTHDYFRWQEARWRLLARASELGIATNVVDGGYEMNAWNHFQSYPVLGDANCATPYWFCANRPYAITFNPGEGATSLAVEPIDSWLGTYPYLRLVQK